MIFSFFFPWTNFNLNQLDSQPTPIILSSIYLIFTSRLKNTFTYNHIIAILTVPIVFIIIVWTTPESSSIAMLRGLLNYLSIPLILLASTIYIKHYGVPTKVLITSIYIWIFSGILQIYFPDILELFGRVRTDGTRGQTAFAPEPSAAGVMMYFFCILVYLDTSLSPLKKYLIFLLNLMAGIFIFNSALFVVLCLITLILTSHALIKKLKSKGFIIFVILAVAIFQIFSVYSGSNRLTYLSTQIISINIDAILSDHSVNSRLAAVTMPIHSSLTNYLIPNGFGSVTQNMAELSNSHFSWITTVPNGYKFMSYLGEMIYQTGFLSIIIISLLFFRCKNNLDIRLSILASLIFSIPLSFPPLYLAISILKYKQSKFLDQNAC